MCNTIWTSSNSNNIWTITITICSCFFSFFFSFIFSFLLSYSFCKNILNLVRCICSFQCCYNIWVHQYLNPDVVTALKAADTPDKVQHLGSSILVIKQLRPANEYYLHLLELQS